MANGEQVILLDCNKQHCSKQIQIRPYHIFSSLTENNQAKQINNGTFHPSLKYKCFEMFTIEIEKDLNLTIFQV
jgi:hypothetical protein